MGRRGCWQVFGAHEHAVVDDYIGGMNRALLRANVVPLTPASHDDLSPHTTVAERLALVAELTAEMWALAGTIVPVYTRSEMPVAMITRTAHEA